MKIGIVAPASRIEPAVAEQVTTLAARLYPEAELFFHPQCFLSRGHFAGTDKQRAAAFLEVANDPDCDALWVARGGYGSNRILPALAGLKPAAKNKLYMGYSDAGFLLGPLYARGHRVAHGPMPKDITRDGGEAAVTRALRYLLARAPDTLEPHIGDAPVAAFNLKILSHLIGTEWMPDLSGHVLMVEEVSEQLYAIDRVFFQVTAHAPLRAIAGLRMGRVSDVPPNDPPFGQSEEDIARHWCDVAGVPYLGRADIGHDVDNKVVPFGRG